MTRGIGKEKSSMINNHEFTLIDDVAFLIFYFIVHSTIKRKLNNQPLHNNHKCHLERCRSSLAKQLVQCSRAVVRLSFVSVKLRM